MSPSPGRQDRQPPSLEGGCLHGQGQNRTADTVIFSHVLYQLSYLASGGGI